MTVKYSKQALDKKDRKNPPWPPELLGFYSGIGILYGLVLFLFMAVELSIVIGGVGGLIIFAYQRNNPQRWEPPYQGYTHPQHQLFKAHALSFVVLFILTSFTVGLDQLTYSGTSFGLWSFFISIPAFVIAIIVYVNTIFTNQKKELLQQQALYAGVKNKLEDKKDIISHASDRESYTEGSPLSDNLEPGLMADKSPELEPSSKEKLISET